MEKTTLKRILHEMGFKWKRCGSKRKILIERTDVVDSRCAYLQKIKKLREEGKPIFFLDETWVDTNLTFRKSWQSESVFGVVETGNASSRLIVVHIGSADGFLAGCELVYKAGSTVGDYHGQMNATNFEKWVREKVIPNLEAPSVIIFDNAPYHGKQVDKPPCKNSLKQVIIDYLRRNGVACDESMRKSTLFQLVEQVKPKQKVFRVDKLLESHGHTVIRLPPYMCDLNAIELAWSKVKRFVRDHNTTGDTSLVKLQAIVREAIKNVTAADWAGYYQHIIKLEEEYWVKDAVMEDAVDSLVISLGANEDSDDESADEGTDEAAEDGDDEEDGGMEEDEVLAVPLPLD